MMGPWLSTFVVTLIAVAVAMLGLGVGLLIVGRPLRSSCGGTAGACLCDSRNPRCNTLEEPT
jgi:hypothetical protein